MLQPPAAGAEQQLFEVVFLCQQGHCSAGDQSLEMLSDVLLRLCLGGHRTKLILARARTGLREGGREGAVQRLRTPHLARGTDVRCETGCGSRTKAENRLEGRGGAGGVRFGSISPQQVIPPCRTWDTTDLDTSAAQ